MTRQATVLPVLVGIVLLASGCGGDDAKDVAEDFWEALQSGGVEEAKPYITKPSELMVCAGITPTYTGGVTFGEVEIKGSRATIVTIPDEPTDDLKEFITYLAKEDGDWKVDMLLTMLQLDPDQLPLEGGT